jgi:hypothetical protein
MIFSLCVCVDRLDSSQHKNQNIESALSLLAKQVLISIFSIDSSNEYIDNY